MTTKPKLRILVVEDNFLTRLGTVTFLQEHDDLDVVGEAADGVEGLAKYKELLPDIVVVDLKMPRLDGVQLTAQLCSGESPAKILVLTHYDGDENIMRALKAGARGYLTKDSHGDEIVLALRKIHAGERYLPQQVATRLVDQMASASLTLRELQVLHKVNEGLSNGEIAESLGLSLKTAGRYVGQVIEKLGAKNRTDAARIARQRGILSVD